MEVAIVTVGDELLAGETENTNATWLCRQVTDRGATVTRVLVVPDERGVIADAVSEYAAAFDAVIVTGGLGDTHDDVTMAGVADGLDRELVVDPDAKAAVEATIAEFREQNPELVERHPELSIDVDAQASIPDGGHALDNEVGLAPGCVVANVYVLPGIPGEMRATFEAVAPAIGGDAVTETLYTPAPEGALADPIATASERHAVTVGSYPGTPGTPNRIRIRGTDPAVVAEAAGWLRERIETVAPEDGGE